MKGDIVDVKGKKNKRIKKNKRYTRTKSWIRPK